MSKAIKILAGISIVLYLVYFLDQSLFLIGSNFNSISFLIVEGYSSLIGIISYTVVSVLVFRGKSKSWHFLVIGVIQFALYLISLAIFSFNMGSEIFFNISAIYYINPTITLLAFYLWTAKKFELTLMFYIMSIVITLTNSIILELRFSFSGFGLYWFLNLISYCFAAMIILLIIKEYKESKEINVEIFTSIDDSQFE